MASLDVKSLFTNVPVDFTINLIQNNIFSNGVKKFNGLTRLQLRKFLEWTCTRTVFQFGGNYYEQVDGVSMGSPIAPLMADVCMNWVLDQMDDFNLQPQMLMRYVDDIFCVFKCKSDLDLLFGQTEFYPQEHKIYQRAGTT